MAEEQGKKAGNWKSDINDRLAELENKIGDNSVEVGGSDKAIEDIAKITDRLERLENIVIKMAHYAGHGRIILEAGMDPWVPGKKDMSKYKDEK